MLKTTISFISESYPIPEAELVVREERDFGDGYLRKKFVIVWENVVVCEWSETVSDYSNWTVYSIGRETYTDQGEPFKRIKKICYSNLSGLFVEKYKSLLTTVKEQQSKIKELENENAKLLYAPGGEGALKAQRHFESLAQ
ncbi:hypothetical protein A9K97_gp341 [Tokyovirus A1]|uniref:hypothetical protein n=1 Tax=Tokyovirus A1 TaxID=1826170 RepID=UPI0007A95FB5|nr:hypothetical protein A9K97_gp341 [Tokyovirus A1]BAU80010.1 conserved hypothetical protein [Tokyovirus A1]